MKRVYKPNLVPRFHVVAIIHLGRALPHGSSGLPGNAAGSLRTPERAAQFSFPYLALHREEFTWPQLLPATPVSSYLTVSPITTSARQTFEISNLKFQIWLVYSLLHLSSRIELLRPYSDLFSRRRYFVRFVPGRYPARCPMVFGLSSFDFSKAITRRASLSWQNEYSKKC